MISSRGKIVYWSIFLQILFTEFVDWALEKNLDIEDDADEEATSEEPAPAEEAAE